MDSVFLQLLLFGAAAASANVLGGLILFPSRNYKNYKKLLNICSRSAQALCSPSLFSRFCRKPLQSGKKPIRKTRRISRADDSAARRLSFNAVFRTYRRAALSPRRRSSLESFNRSALGLHGIGGLLIHTFFDGVSIAAAAQLDLKVGFLVFIAVFLHKFPKVHNRPR
jgi:hypothetical protein